MVGSNAFTITILQLKVLKKTKKKENRMNEKVKWRIWMCGLFNYFIEMSCIFNAYWIIRLKKILFYFNNLTAKGYFAIAIFNHFAGKIWNGFPIHKFIATPNATQEIMNFCMSSLNRRFSPLFSINNPFLKFLNISISSLTRIFHTFIIYQPNCVSNCTFSNMWFYCVYYIYNSIWR